MRTDTGGAEEGREAEPGAPGRVVPPGDRGGEKMLWAAVAAPGGAGITVPGGHWPSVLLPRLSSSFLSLLCPEGSPWVSDQQLRREVSVSGMRGSGEVGCQGERLTPSTWSSQSLLYHQRHQHGLVHELEVSGEGLDQVAGLRGAAWTGGPRRDVCPQTRRQPGEPPGELPGPHLPSPVPEAGSTVSRLLLPEFQ